MKKSIIKTVVLAALMALPMFTKAQTFAGITAEQNAQNTQMCIRDSAKSVGKLTLKNSIFTNLCAGYGFIHMDAKNGAGHLDLSLIHI